jgi:hypothetical protein
VNMNIGVLSTLQGSQKSTNMRLSSGAIWAIPVERSSGKSPNLGGRGR